MIKRDVLYMFLKLKKESGELWATFKMAIHELPVTVGLSRLCCLKPHGYCFLNHHKISTRINSNICVLRKVSHLFISKEHVVFSALLQKGDIQLWQKCCFVFILNFQQLDLFYLSQYGKKHHLSCIVLKLNYDKYTFTCTYLLLSHFSITLFVRVPFIFWETMMTIKADKIL